MTNLTFSRISFFPVLTLFKKLSEAKEKITLGRKLYFFQYMCSIQFQVLSFDMVNQVFN